MSNNVFGEGFPYTNFHNLNMDWIIKIAKDFLDQYTHIQDVITSGLNDLDDKTNDGIEALNNLYTDLNNLLQQWYDTHSADIANQLATALNDLNAWYTQHINLLDQAFADKILAFNTAADAKAAETIASIPADYTALTNTVNDIIDQLIKYNCYDYILATVYGTSKTDSFGGVDFVWSGNTVEISGTASGAQSSNCIVSPSSLLGMEKGKTYRFVNNCTDSRVAFTLYITKDNGTNWIRVAYIYGTEYDYTIPNDVTGFLMRVDVGNGDTVDCAATIHAYNTLTQQEIIDLFSNYICAESTTYNRTGSLDCNAMLGNHIWLLDSDHTYTNIPNGFTLGFVMTVECVGYHLQLAWQYTGGKMWKRRGTDATPPVWEDWTQLTGITNTYNNTYNFSEYENTYNITASPSFTTDVNAYLAPSGSVDRTADIVSALTTYGICRLGKGIYYIKNLVMPNDTTIEGVGDGTLLVMTNDADFGIKMGSTCICKKFNLVGKLATITPNATVRSKTGILWQGDYTQTETSTTQPKRSIISELFLAHFEGSAITCYDTGYGTYNHLEVTNVYIWDCDAGINISYFSEFHKFTNVRANECYYGCVNNGGNNIFVNCDFSTNKIGFLMDNSQGQSPNNSHGSAIGCIFNHADSNNGIGIKILNCDNGFIFDGCQIFFSQVYIEDSDGIVISSSNFGSDNITITISGGNTVLFANNMHQGSPTISITDNTKVHFVNCYNRSTGATIGN